MHGRACNPVLTRNPDHYLDVDAAGMETGCHHLAGFLYAISFHTASGSTWSGPRGRSTSPARAMGGREVPPWRAASAPAPALCGPRSRPHSQPSSGWR